MESAFTAKYDFYSMAKKAQTTPSTETLEPKIYEIGYLLSPAVRDEDLAVRLNELKESLTKFGANIFAEGDAEFIDLAYEMAKVIDNKRIRFNQAYFGWLKFELDPSKINEMKEGLDKNINLVRYLLILSTRENTVISKKPLGKILKAGKRETITETDIPAEIVVDTDEIEHQAVPEVPEVIESDVVAEVESTEEK